VRSGRLLLGPGNRWGDARESVLPFAARSPPVASRGRRICLPIPRWRANPIGYQPSNIRTDVTGVSAVSRVATVRTYPP